MKWNGGPVRGTKTVLPVGKILSKRPLNPKNLEKFLTFRCPVIPSLGFGQEMKKEEKKQSKGRYLNPNERFEPQLDDDLFKVDDQEKQEDQPSKKKRIRHKKPKNSELINDIWSVKL